MTGILRQESLQESDATPNTPPQRVDPSDRPLGGYRSRIPIRGLALGLVLLSAGCAASRALATPADPLMAMIQRLDTDLHRNEQEGVTPDPRLLLNPREQIRLTVVSQLLGYCELYRTSPTRVHYEDICRRADFLALHFDSLLTGTAFDGMLGYALLGAYQLSGNPRYLALGQAVVDECLRLEDFDMTLNWGLMAAMALARYEALTGSAEAARKVNDILLSLGAYQHDDGSFPHYCAAAKDVHYTAWMAMELILVDRDHPSELIDGYLARIRPFMDTRVGSDGRATYEGPCEPPLLCTAYYFSRASGCRADYDTRGWVNELGYEAVLFDRFRDPKYAAVIEFLNELEDRGAFADKWGYLPPPGDPVYPWASATRSLIRSSLVFWSLTSVLSERATPKPVRYVKRSPLLALATPPPFLWCEPPVGVFWGPDDLLRLRALRGAPGKPAPGSGDHGPGPDLRPQAWESHIRSVPDDTRLPTFGITAVLPNPAGERAAVRFRLSREAPVELEFFDAAGRRLRALRAPALAPGEHAIEWDRRDESGHRVPAGTYFVRLITPEQSASARLIVLP